MTGIENHAHVSNQAGIQNIYGNVVFNHPETLSKRPRPEIDESGLEKALDDKVFASLAFPQIVNRRSNIESAHPQTCLWLFELDEYKSWKAEPSGLLWIKGKPGSGKSTLISHLYHDLWLDRQLDHINLEFFFSARGALLQHTFVGMLRSLLSQIYHRNPDIRHPLRAAYNEKCSYLGTSQTDCEWTLPELKRQFTDALLASSRQHQTVLLIDALDEAGEEAAAEIASFFHAINDHVTKSSAMARICISCRHYPIPPSKTGAAEILVESHNHADIALYVNDHIKAGHSTVDESRQDLDAIARTLTKNASGIFQWVCLVTPMVSKWLREGETTEQILKSLSKVPEGLEAVYKHILINVIDPRYRRKTLRLFQWACLAPRPLTVTEARYALSAEDIKVEKVLVRCHEVSGFETSNLLMRRRIITWSGGLLEATAKQDYALDLSSYDELGTIQVIHQSVNDFMTEGGLSLLLALNDAHPEIKISSLPLMNLTNAIQMSHGLLYSLCLKYLCAERPNGNPLETEISSEPSRISTRLVNSRQYPFWDYAITYCLVHAERSGGCCGLNLEHQTWLLEKSLWAWNFAYKMSALDYQIEFRSRFHSETTVIHLAAAANLTNLIEYRIESGDDLNRSDSRGWTAMHTAASLGYLAVIMLLHENGADINAKTELGDTPLLLATRSGHERVSIFLLRCGANCDAMNTSSETTLYTASCRGSVEIMRMCIESGADANLQGGFYGNALQAAAKYTASNKELKQRMVRLLLKAGADVNAQGGHFGNALQAAAYEGCQQTVSILLEAGAEVSAQGGHFGNALQAAAPAKGACKEGIVGLLLSAGADVNAQGGHFGNALQAAVSFGWKRHERAAERAFHLLLQAGADVNAQGGFHGSALQAAAGYPGDTVEPVRLLLEAGADVNARGGSYGSALRSAQQFRNPAIVDMLLAAGAEEVESEVDSTDSDASSPMPSEADDETFGRNRGDRPSVAARENDSSDGSAGNIESGGSWLLQMLGRFFP